MAMNLMFALAALIHESQFEESSNIGTLAGECNKNGDISGMILGILSVGVEVNRPLVASDGEILAGNVFADAHAFGQGVTLDDELVGAIDGLGHGPRTGGREQRGLA